MLLPLIASALLAVSVVADSVNTYSQQVCRTALKPSQGSGGTTTQSTTKYLTKTVTQTITPTVTITPTSTTLTKKTTTTKWSSRTLPQSTSIFSTTLSFTITSSAYTTLISTLTSSVSSTTTSTFTTTTIQPSPGFVAISSALAAEGHAAAKRARRGAEVASSEPVAVEIQERATQQKIICGNDGTITYDPPQYKGLVICNRRVQITSTSTKTSTTITRPPVASTTITISTTSTLSTTFSESSTTTTFITSISTIYQPQPTYYAACGPSNTISYVDNTRIANIAAINPENGFSFGSGATGAYECCVQCILSGTCGASTWHPAAGVCYFFPFGTSGTCSATEEVGTFAKGSGSATVGFVVSNSNCGEIEFAG
ncbi:hypothetical protein CBER1_00440 [Cercospora berteroae]|uniref:Apple domain-containing protein n=1 Tax=Cercospora berteroae TaxID=357750 RepID=A0A2S6C1I5_9PEZI|nr:hypothetical protein CBER1_00440 [Cercospora berteroae]